MKVAFATSDGVHLDERFRRASRLDVYEVDERGARLHGSHTFPPDRTVKTEARLIAIAGASIVYGTAFIPSAAARIAASGIRPATAPTGTPIAELLERLVESGRG